VDEPEAPADEVSVTEPVEAEPAKPVARGANPTVVGAGRARTLSDMGAGGPPGIAGASSGPADYSNVGRNDPCPCGSGKKFKKCHGA
jgi:preprotein translocase subunit SecA